MISIARSKSRQAKSLRSSLLNIWTSDLPAQLTSCRVNHGFAQAIPTNHVSSCHSHARAESYPGSGKRAGVATWLARLRQDLQCIFALLLSCPAQAGIQPRPSAQAGGEPDLTMPQCSTTLIPFSPFWSIRHMLCETRWSERKQHQMMPFGMLGRVFAPIYRRREGDRDSQVAGSARRESGLTPPERPVAGPLRLS